MTLLCEAVIENSGLIRGSECFSLVRTYLPLNGNFVKSASGADLDPFFSCIFEKKLANHLLNAIILRV